MAYQAPKKKKEWWETALNVAGKAAGNVAGRAVDYVVPGDQSSLYRNKQVLPTFKPSIPQPVVNTAKNVGSAFWNSTVNPIGKNGLFGTKQQESFSNFIKPAVSGLNRYQSAIDSTDTNAGFQWNDPNDYKRFAQKLPAGMVQGVIEAPTKVGEAMTGQRIRDGKVEDISLGQRTGTMADAYLSTAGLAMGGSGTFLKSLVPGARNASTGFVRAAGGIVKDGVKEGAEEVLQLAASDKADNNRFDATWKDYRDAAGLGTLAGSAMSGAGATLTGVKTNVQKGQNAPRAISQGGFIGGRNATGFKQAEAEGKVFRGAMDKMPRFEVSDADMKFRPDYDTALHLSTDAVIPLDKVIKHDRLFEQYPQARDVYVAFHPNLGTAKGAYNESSNTLYLNPNSPLNIEDQLKTIVHENQHFIQGVENFARGSSPSLRKNKRLEAL